MSNLRNILIVLTLAALVAIVPGGGTAANVLVQAISLAFLASIAWVAMVMYREHRISLYSLGDVKRGVLYGAAGVLTLTLSASGRLWGSTGGKFAWLALLAAVVYAVAAVIFSARRA